MYVIGGLMLLCNIGQIGYAASYKIFPNDKIAYFWVDCSLVCLIDVTFGVAHLLLAFTYRKISREHPEILKGRQIEGKRREKIAFWTLLTLNTFAPFLEILEAQLFIEEYVYKETKVKRKLIEMNTICHFCILFLELISGGMIIHSLLVIKRSVK